MAIEINKGISVNQTAKPIETDHQKIDDHKYIPQKYKEVAQNMEQQFSEYMLNQMNQAVDINKDEEDSNGMDYYKGLQTTERAKLMAQTKTLGLQDVILDQIYPKRMRTEMGLKQYEAQAERFNHKLPKLVQEDKSDRIVIGKNESSSLIGSHDVTDLNKEGGLK